MKTKEIIKRLCKKTFNPCDGCDMTADVSSYCVRKLNECKNKRRSRNDY